MTIGSSTIGSLEFESSFAQNQKDVPPPEVSDKKLSAETGPKFEVADTERLKSVLAQSNISLNFRRDEASGRIVIEMIDSNTGDAVRQIPSEVSLRLSELFSKVQGQLFEARA